MIPLGPKAAIGNGGWGGAKKKNKKNIRCSDTSGVFRLRLLKLKAVGGLASSERIERPLSAEARSYRRYPALVFIIS